MGMMELFLIAVGLSMDACAVAVCKGLGMTRVNRKQAVMIALFFGVFQGGMPLIGWALGTQFEQYIVSVDHWIALILLGLIGGNMIRESFGKEEEEAEMDAPLNYKELTLMAVATSIDALAVGVTLAFLRVNIVPRRVLHRRDHLRHVAGGGVRGQLLRRAVQKAGRAPGRRHPDPDGAEDFPGAHGDHRVEQKAVGTPTAFFILLLRRGMPPPPPAGRTGTASTPGQRAAAAAAPPAAGRRWPRPPRWRRWPAPGPVPGRSI